MDELLQAAYHPENFRKTGHQLIDLLANHLEHVQSGQRPKTIYFDRPDGAFEFWENQLSAESPEKLSSMDFFQEVLNRAIAVHHPNYMGHQVCSVAPEAALAALVDSLLNNGGAVYEMGMVGTPMERAILKKLARKIGFGEEAEGIITSGGTLANLTALLAARQVKAKDQVWESGSNSRLALLVSEEAHYCVDRAARIMGWGSEGIIKIPSDDRFRMRTELLEEYYEQAKAEGKEVIAVVGSACSTSTGSFDDLEAIGQFCQQHQLWFHVDGAHGGAFVFSKQHKELLNGIEMADSVVTDFHKMMMTPSITTALVFKNGRHSYQTFAQKAHYLWSSQTEQEWYNMGKRTFECTKSMMVIKIYRLMHQYGDAFFESYLDQMMALSQRFASMLAAHPAFEMACPPQCNIVCFRVHPHEDEAQNDALNLSIRQALLEEGTFYIVQTNIRGRHYLRVTLINPNTNEQHLAALMGRISELAGIA
ncbi:MAG TPA: aminotransferase class I/II-fold pyridoxal phosphate-dependent enzyme [Saprospiraceae bacterium]|nr:aminotransferase class I/II-fold pyridoxal phosphate-dependent enzyme [Saprospiraceae bacterium]HMQ84309.1 aminotransferase class I/II-fold pyridoxal phosphate-dependent enzyme [Saprospiraceae bacterium]